MLPILEHSTALYSTITNVFGLEKKKVATHKLDLFEPAFLSARCTGTHKSTGTPIHDLYPLCMREHYAIQAYLLSIKKNKTKKPK